MTTITRFTKEQLIARINKQIDINATIIERLGDDSAAVSELAVKTATMDLKILDIALASLDAGSDSHPAHSPLSNDRLHRISDILRKAAAQSDGGNIGYAMSDAVRAFDELLEVRKAEPVGYYRKGSDGFYFASPTEQRPGTIPLYTAPVVPEAKCDDDGNTTSEFDHGWNACRAAILNHSGDVINMVEHVRQPYKLPPHVYRELVNQLHSTVMKYSGCQQLREQISRTLGTVLGPAHSHIK